MIVKALQLLKRNPVIVIFYVIFLLISFAILFLLYPRDLTRFTNASYLQSFDFRSYILTMMKLIMASVIIYILGLVFSSGFCNMMTEAVMSSKTSARSFPVGIARFFVRMLLATLLLIAMVFGFSIALNILIIPLTIALTLSGSSAALILLITIVSMILAILAVPFVILWIPAIFIEDTGVIQGLKLGWKAGIKNYVRLLLLLAVIYIPILLYTIFSFRTITEGQIFTIGYFILIIVEAIISILYMPLIFLMYSDYSQSLRKPDSVPMI